MLLPCLALTADDNIRQLIEGLDSPQYSVRERATKQLVQMGKPALRSLAQQYFSSTPEEAWRIKRILEQIGTTNDDPETCFKSIGILFVLDANIGGGIVELLNDWRDNRSKKAMDFLASQGMQFSREYTGINRQIEALNIDIRQVLEEELAGRKKQSSPIPKTAKKMAEFDAKAAYERVNQILSGSLAENESFVWELYNSSQTGIPNSTDQASNSRLQGDPIFRNDRIILRQNGAILNFTNGSSANLVATLNENWQGNSADLKRLSQIHQLNGIRFYRRTLSAEDAEVAANLRQLQFLAIQGCELDGFELHDIPFPKSIQSLYLANARLERPTIKMLADLKLQVLDLTEVEFSPEAENNLSTLQTVREMGWTRTPISGSMFEQMTQLPALNTINLSVSKFQYEDKKRFSEKRPECRFNNLPVAFLGVQGPQTISSYQRDADCLIEQVVADSSAAKAGIEPGDIIRKVDGQPITKFEELRMFITQHDIGESLELDVERDGKVIKIPVKLGNMDQAQVR